MLKIVHISDIHIYNNERFIEYQIVFDKLFTLIKKEKCDLVVIAGDLFHDKLTICNESKIFAADFLNKLSSIVPVRIIHGNHDLNVKNLTRVNTVKTIIELINNPSIIYMEETGFYDDPIFTDIVWAVHAHKYKDNNPWIITPIEKDQSKTYISLFHDPINGYLNPKLEVVSKSEYRSLSEFTMSDFTMSGDIHIIQSHLDNRFWYSGSLLQQNHGERLSDGVDFRTFHGGLIWEIDNKKANVKPFDIQSDYNYITFDIECGFDYNNINFQHPQINPCSNIRIKWGDYQSNMGFANEITIRKYFKDTFGIKKIKFFKKGIKVNINESNMLTESLDILNPDIQRQLFIEYLTLNKVDSGFFTEILELDDMITKMINTNFSNGISWTIRNIWFDNFQSYGGFYDIDFTNKAGIIQISGHNRTGKTTILDAICYVLYGKTIATDTKDKFKDIAYLNNKLNLNVCKAGISLDINGEIFSIIRQTERKYAKDKVTVNGCSTTVNYYVGDIKPENLLTGDSKNDTQRKIDSAIGNFDDFIRLVLTTADNLNGLISIDRAEFIDSVVKDAGYDIFELKTDAFKTYKKTLKDDRIVINITDTTKRISNIEEELENIKNELSLNDNEIIDIQSNIAALEIKKSDIQKTLKPINDDLIDFNVDTVNSIKNNHEIEIEKLNNIIDDTEKLKKIVSEYDGSIYDKKIEDQKQIVKNISDIKLSISNFKIQIAEFEHDISAIDLNIEKSKNLSINKVKEDIILINNDINSSKQQFTDFLHTQRDNIKTDISKLDIELNNIQNSIQNKMTDGKKIVDENKELELSKVCYACDRVLEKENLVVIANKIELNKQTLSHLQNEVKELKIKYQEIDNQNQILKSNIEKISNKDFSFDDNINNMFKTTQELIISKRLLIDSHNAIINDINLGIYTSDLQEYMDIQDDKTTQLLSEISKINKSILLKNNEKTIKDDEFNKINIEIEDLLHEKKDIEAKQKRIYECNESIIRKQSLLHEIDGINTKIKLYHYELENIQFNKKIENDILLITKEISLFFEKINTLNDIKTRILTREIFNRHELEKLIKDKLKFEEQQHKDEIYNIYLKCIHRDGLPTFLLKKSIHIINEELSNLLENIDFVVYFDDDLKMKLSNKNRLDVSQNAIQGSGMERSFIACVLKIALRSINNKSRCNVLIFDEIMGKLDSESVDLMRDIFETLKTRVQNLIIIEHIHPIAYDFLIKTDKNQDGISSMTIE